MSQTGEIAMGQSVRTIATVHAAGPMTDENGLKESQSLYITVALRSVSQTVSILLGAAHMQSLRNSVRA